MSRPQAAHCHPAKRKIAMRANEDVVEKGIRPTDALDVLVAAKRRFQQLYPEEWAQLEAEAASLKEQEGQDARNA